MRYAIILKSIINIFDKSFIFFYIRKLKKACNKFRVFLGKIVSRNISHKISYKQNLFFSTITLLQ